MASQRRIFWTTVACAVVVFCCPVRAEIVIGVAVPSQGPKSALGSVIQSALETEANALNAKGGLGGQRIQLQFADDVCSTSGGAAVAEGFVAAKAVLVVGHPCSTAAIAAAKIYAAAHIPFVAIGATHPDLTLKRAGPAVFRLAGRDDRQAVETAVLIASTQSGNRIAIVHDRTVYSRTLADNVTLELKALGVTPVTRATIVAGEKTYSDLITQLKQARTQMVYFAGFPSEAALVIEGLQKAGLSIPVFGSDSLADLRAPLLTVIQPRQLHADDITGIIEHMVGRDPKSATSNVELERHVWGSTGDELLPSFAQSLKLGN